MKSVDLDRLRRLMSGKRLIRIGFWAVVAVAAILLIRAIVDDDDSSSPETTSAEIVSVDELRESADSRDEPVYWAGAQAGAELELSRPADDRTYVRYLTDGAEAGDPGVDFLTVGSYAYPDAVAVLKDQGKESGGVNASAPGGGVVYFNRSRPQSVYLAYPGEDVQIEVYDPNPRRALGLVASGQIVPIG